MKIQEKFYVKGIFHYDKSNNESLYMHMFIKFVFQVCRGLFC